jgi:hypothetical protein
MLKMRHPTPPLCIVLTPHPYLSHPPPTILFTHHSLSPLSSFCCSHRWRHRPSRAPPKEILACLVVPTVESSAREGLLTCFAVRAAPTRRDHRSHVGRGEEATAARCSRRLGAELATSQVELAGGQVPSSLRIGWSTSATRGRDLRAPGDEHPGSGARWWRGRP